MSEWKKKKSVPEKEKGAEKEEQSWLWYFCSAAVLTVGEDHDDEDDGGDDDDVEEESTMRHRCNKRDENLDSSHSVAPASANGSTTPPNFDLRHSDPGQLDFPPLERVGATFRIRSPPCLKKKTNNSSIKVFMS